MCQVSGVRHAVTSLFKPTLLFRFSCATIPLCFDVVLNEDQFFIHNLTLGVGLSPKCSV